MPFDKSFLLAVFAAAFLFSPALAKPVDGMLTPEQMKIIRECAAKKGVEMPEPPPDGAKGGDSGQHGAMTERSSMPRRKGPHHRMLTDEQRVIVDECFKENRIEPPKHMGPPHGIGNAPKAQSVPSDDKVE